MDIKCVGPKAPKHRYDACLSKDVFGGDCSRIARIRTVLDEVVLSDMNCNDQRVKASAKDMFWSKYGRCGMRAIFFAEVRTCTEACDAWQATKVIT